jgi:hypothetical protein
MRWTSEGTGMMRPNLGDVQRALRDGAERRRRQVTWSALALIITGLIVVENDHSAFQTGGLLLTVSGVAILVVMLRGAFDLELRMVNSIAHALEDAHYDDAALALLWREAAAKAAVSTRYNALVVLRAVEIVRERRRTTTDIPPKNRASGEEL